MQLPLGSPYAIGSCLCVCACVWVCLCECVGMTVCHSYNWSASASHLPCLLSMQRVCNDCYSNFPFTVQPRCPLLRHCLSAVSPAARSLCICPSSVCLPVCLVLIPQRVCLLLLLLPSILHQTRVCRAVSQPHAPPPLPSPSASPLATPLFIWRICYPYTAAATFGQQQQRGLLCKMHVLHTMSLSETLAPTSRQA